MIIPLKADAAGIPRAPVALKAGTDVLENLAIVIIWMVCISAVMREILGQTFLYSFGSYSLHVVDPVAVATIIAAVMLGARYKPPLQVYSFLIFAISAIILLNLVRGFEINTNAALLWARANLQTAALLVLGLYVRPTVRLMAAIRVAMLVAGSAIAALVFVRLFAGPTFLMTFNEVDASMVNDGGRPIASHGAFFLALSSILLWAELFRKGLAKDIRITVLGFLLVSALILSGQGTTAVAFIAMFGTLMIFQPGRLHRERVFVGIFALLLLIVVLSTVDFSGAWRWSDTGNWKVSRRMGSLRGRQELWAELMRVFPTYTTFEQLFGLPAGRIPRIVLIWGLSVREWTLSIHSMYFGSLVTMGYLGLGCFLLLLIYLLSRSFSGALAKSFAMPAYPLAFCVGTAVIAISYEIRNEMWLGLFVALLWIRGRREVMDEHRHGAGRRPVPIR